MHGDPGVAHVIVCGSLPLTNLQVNGLGGKSKSVNATYIAPEALDSHLARQRRSLMLAGVAPPGVDEKLDLSIHLREMAELQRGVLASLRTGPGKDDVQEVPRTFDISDLWHQNACTLSPFEAADGPVVLPVRTRR